MTDDYVDRYCAFVDILGFRSLVDNLGSGALQFEKLRDLLSKIHTPFNIGADVAHVDFRAQSISDAVAISAAVHNMGLFSVLIALKRLAVDLLKEGYLIRGALVKGKLYHDDKMVFGGALVRAYQLENNTARFPRVMVTRDVIQDIANYNLDLSEANRGTFDQYIRQADDGPHYVHVLRDVESAVAKLQTENLNLKADKQHALKEYSDLQDTIQRLLNQATDNPRHFEKVQWFARYWRRSVPFGVPLNSFISGPGMDHVTWRAGDPVGGYLS